MEEMNNFLKDIRVLELAAVLAGPSVGTFLAELGATVIKIENPNTKGDTTRGWKLASEGKDKTTSAYFASVNWGKEHRFIDMKTEAGKATIYELVKTMDVVITNFKPGSDVKLGMDFEKLKQLKPNIIYGSITGYGDDNPRPAFDAIVQAETGYVSMNGMSAETIHKMPLPLIDTLAAHQLKEGLLLALFQRERTGEGAHVTCSLYDAGLSALTNQASNWLMEQHIPQATGSRHPNIAPYGDFISTKDHQQIMLAAGAEIQFRNLCQVLGCPELALDERFDCNVSRVANRTELMECLNERAINFSASFLMKALLDNHVPAGLVKNLKQVFEDEEAQKMVLEDTMDDGRTGRRVRQAAFKFS